MIGILIALSAGILSFLSPCVLPIVPPYLAYISGISLSDMEASNYQVRKKVILSTLYFVLGLSTIFLLLGLTVSGQLSLIIVYKDWLFKISGVIIIVFGLHFVGLFKVAFLNKEIRIKVNKKGGSYISSYIFGLAFALGWTPCIGPILGSILILAASESSIERGMTMLASYAAGMSLPFVIVAAFFPKLTYLISFIKKRMNTIEKISGSLLLVVGIMMFTGNFAMISYWILEYIPYMSSLG